MHFDHALKTSRKILSITLGLGMNVLMAAEPDSSWIQEKKSTEIFGKHSVLNVENVELQFKLDPTKVSQRVYDPRDPYQQNINQQLGFGLDLNMGAYSKLSHGIFFGANQERIWRENDFRERETQKFQQRQVTTFQIKPYRSLVFNLSNEAMTEQRNNQDRGSEALKQVASFEYSLPLGISLRPELSHETARNDLWQETERQTTSVNLRKSLVPNVLDLQLRPSLGQEEQQFTYGKYSEYEAVEMSLSWKPQPSLLLTSGANLREINIDQDMSLEKQSTIYSQATLSLWADLMLNFRTDFNNTEKTQNNSGIVNDESHLNLTFGPTMKISETFSAGAELGYKTILEAMNQGQKDEQSLSLSIRGTF